MTARILAIDTTSETGSIALLENGVVVEQALLHSPQSYAQILYGELQALLGRHGWSLNLIDGMIYTSTARGCGSATSVISAIDVATPKHPVSKFYPSNGKASGPWGRGGIVRTPWCAAPPRGRCKLWNGCR